MLEFKALISAERGAYTRIDKCLSDLDLKIPSTLFM